MTHRFDSLEAAIADIGAGASANGRRIVVSWAWWDALSETERGAGRAREVALRTALGATTAPLG